MVDDHIEQRAHVVCDGVQFQTGDAINRAGIDRGKVELFVAATQIVEQFEDLIDGSVRIGTRSIDFIDDDNGLQAIGECFLRHEARLRHWPINRVDQQQHGIDHGQDTLNFTTKIRVSRSVHNIDLGIAVVDCRVLSQNRYATFFF